MKKLLNYQQEGLNLCNKESFVILNWCRNAGKTFIIPIIIENNDMKNCIYYGCDFDNLKYKIQNFTSFEIIESNKYVIHMSKNKQNYSIWNGADVNLNKELKYDCIFYDEYLPCINNIQSSKVVCTLTINNHTHWIEYLFPTAKVMNVDYNEVVENNLLNERFLFNSLSTDNGLERFKKEYGILYK